MVPCPLRSTSMKTKNKPSIAYTPLRIRSPLRHESSACHRITGQDGLTNSKQGAPSFAADGIRAACRRTVPERFHSWNDDLMAGDDDGWCWLW